MNQLKEPRQLGKREREIVEVIYRSGQATAKDVMAGLAQPPTYSAVRGSLRVLVEKGVLKVTLRNNKNIYEPVLNKEKAGRSALRNLIHTFFAGSPEVAAATLLDISDDLSPETLDRLKNLVSQAEKDGR